MSAALSETVVVPTWSLADRLRKVRREVAGMSQAEFAAAIGVGRQAYATWEVGRGTPRNQVAVARNIEAVTGVPRTWILGMGAPTQEIPAAAGIATMRALLEDQISDITHPILRRFAEQGVQAALEWSVADAQEDPAKTVPITQRRQGPNAEKSS